MKNYFLLLLLLSTAVPIHAQTNFQISSFHSTPEDFKLLLLPNNEIAKNDTINERILDLAEPWLADSILPRRKEHHQLFFVGWLIHAFGGFNWRAVDMHKQKFVGTVRNEGRSGGFEYTEWDIKYHLRFHLRKYLFKDFESYDLARKYHKQDVRPSHHTNFKIPPYVRDTNNMDASIYDLGCELTPPPAFIPQLNYLFFPTLPEGGNCKTHINFETKHPSMGFYGAYCLDCNHNCHPEMHPYEWVWWLKVKDGDESTDKTWLIGLFHEGSNRFPKWSRNPMTGEIKIPFAFDLSFDEEVSAPAITVEHLVFNKFEENFASQLPQNSISTYGKNNDTMLNGYQRIILSAGSDSSSVDLMLKFDKEIKTDALRFWFTEINFDREKKIISGYLHFATSVLDLYTARITFTKVYDN